MKRIHAATNYVGASTAPPVKRVTFAPVPTLIMSRSQRRELLPLSRVIEAQCLNDLENIVDFLPIGTLVAFDLDNMTMEPQQLVGSDQWFEAMLLQLMTKFDGDKKQAFAELIPLYNHVHNHTDVKPVEPHTPLFIHKLHSRHKVIALTTRGKELAIATRRQLSSIDVDFNQSSTHRDREVDLSHIGAASLVTNGIVFAGGKSKGECLKAFMEAMGYTNENTPHILFLDDKPHHVESVKQAALDLGIKFTGVRYSHLDEKIKEVDLLLADLQLTHHQQHGTFLTDEEARQLLKGVNQLADVAASKPKFTL